MTDPRPPRTGPGPFAGLLLALALSAVPALTSPAHAEAPRVHALTGARIVVAPGQVIESGTVVIRDGVITAVGAEVEIPADARVWELGTEGETEVEGDEAAEEATEDHAAEASAEGAAEEEAPPVTLYAGLIDPYTERDWPPAEGDDDEAAAPQDVHENPLVRPEREMSRWAADPAAAKALRRAGFTVAVVAPEPGLLRGTSALVSLGDGALGEVLLSPRVAHNASFETRSFRDGYPTSLMGAIALMRQTLADAIWYARAREAWSREPGQERPPYNRSLEALVPVARGDEPLVFEAESLDDTLRFLELAREAGLAAWLVASGEEYLRPERIAAAGAPVLLPLDFPDTPEVGEEDDLTVGLEELRHWDRAPTTPRALLDAGATVAFTSHGLDDPAGIYAHLSRALDAGLTADEALAALTTTPAQLLGISDLAGTLEAGKLANLVVVEGNLLVEKPKIREVWVDGHRYELQEVKAPEVEPAGTWELTVDAGGGMQFQVVLTLEGEAPSLDGTIGGMGMEAPLSEATVSGKTVRVAFDGASWGMPGTFEMSLQIQGDRAEGSGSGPRGSFSIEGRRVSGPGEGVSRHLSRHFAGQARSTPNAQNAQEVTR